MSARIKGNVLTVNGVRTKISPQQLTILWELMARRSVTKDQLVEALWPNPDKMPDYFYNIICIRIHQLRKVIRPGGWDVINRYSMPYTLERI